MPSILSEEVEDIHSSRNNYKINAMHNICGHTMYICVWPYAIHNYCACACCTISTKLGVGVRLLIIKHKAIFKAEGLIADKASCFISTKP